MIKIDSSKLEQELVKINEKLSRIEALFNVHTSTDSQYISEAKAKEEFGRGSTWFWERRRAGLPYSKLGGQVYYKREDLVALFTQLD